MKKIVIILGLTLLSFNSLNASKKEMSIPEAKVKIIDYLDKNIEVFKKAKECVKIAETKKELRACKMKKIKNKR